MSLLLDTQRSEISSKLPKSSWHLPKFPSLSSLTSLFKRTSATNNPSPTPSIPSSESLSSDWITISLVDDTQIDAILDNWIETDEQIETDSGKKQVTNKGQRRLAAAAIREFIQTEDQTTLDLQALDLVSLPDIFFHKAFRNRLKTLRVEKNAIQDFPPSLKHLENLQKIEGISFALLAKIPEELSLEVVRIEHLDEIPRVRVKTSSEIDLSPLDAWAIEGSPTENRQEAKKRIKAFLEDKELDILDLTDLHLRSLPDIFDQEVFSKRLKFLALSGNELAGGIAPSVKALDALYFVQFEDILENLDQWAKEYAPGEKRFEAWVRIQQFLNDSDANSLDLSGLNLSSLPHIFSHILFIAKLESLDLSYNQLREILPTTFAALRNLQSLNLEHNLLTEIDSSICNLASLKELWLAQNQLYILPPNFGNLTQLQWLDISQNALKELPRSMIACRNLINFNCSQNEIEELPEFETLPRLRTLNVSDNAFTEFPRSLLDDLTDKEVEVTLFSLAATEIEQIVRLNERVTYY